MEKQLKDADYNDFKLQFERLKKALKVNTDLALSKALGISHQSIAGAKRRKQIPLKWFRRLAERYRISPTFILYGNSISSEAEGFNKAKKIEHVELTYDVIKIRIIKSLIKAVSNEQGIKLSRLELKIVQESIQEDLDQIEKKLINTIDLITKFRQVGSPPKM